MCYRRSSSKILLQVIININDDSKITHLLIHRISESNCFLIAFFSFSLAFECKKNNNRHTHAYMHTSVPVSRIEWQALLFLVVLHLSYLHHLSGN